MWGGGNLWGIRLDLFPGGVHVPAGGGFTRLKRVTVEYASSCRIAPYLMHADDVFSARPIFEQSSTLAEKGFQTYLKWVGLTVTPPKKRLLKRKNCVVTVCAAFGTFESCPEVLQSRVFRLLILLYTAAPGSRLSKESLLQVSAHGFGLNSAGARCQSRTCLSGGPSF